MGIVFKFLLIAFVVYYILSKLFGFLFRVLIGRAATQYKNQQQRGYSNANRQRRDGELNVDYVPVKEKPKRKSTGSAHGEYIDFEEVK
ncbi:DUF4834 family protein [Mangrovivirga cuniculi]|uniref:DUF4834 domain-containing protein n=1 Tax=Mangrovivirga cuniculi TaxID=2715131 RepID=A0A4D7J9U6_9BACT|nr:DUF4834 family protein [Mangrovivirga cuniculi]QCK13259.1 hypothetical protein DCC35_00070 [Mangrovivirga cuniculi]